MKKKNFARQPPKHKPCLTTWSWLRVRGLGSTWLKADDGRHLYRFEKPADDKYPQMIEIFSRKPSNVDLATDQQIVPIKLDANSASLSAILLNGDYYELVRQQHNEEKNLPFAIRRP